MPTTANTFDYVNEFWNIADYVRDVIRPADYNKLILPFVLLRRLECALEPTRDNVIALKEKLGGILGRENDQYKAVSGKSFYNVTKFRLNDLGNSNTLEALEQYVSGFSPNAREILEKFRLLETCKLLEEHGMLYEVCKRFAAQDLSADKVSDRMMSDIYEHLIQRYGEEIAQDAEDFMTPRDIVRLAVSMVFANDDELINGNKGAIRTLYDGCAGTCGFICDALDMVNEWQTTKQLNTPTRIVPYGQELEGTTWAIGKSNLMLRNVGDNGQDDLQSMVDLSEHIMRGDTLSEDAFPNEQFNYIVTNPPYGKKWEKEQEAVLSEAGHGFLGRFGAGLPPISDGSMLFLQNVASKLADVEHGGGKAAIVLSASPLFTGDAGSGSSNVRRWLFQKDLIDCIVKLPTQIFFRTGIATYIWILNNKKPESRKGMIQLIDASEIKTSLRKNLGNKRYEVSDEQAKLLVEWYVDGVVNANSVIVPTEDFMFRQVTVQRPIRKKIVYDPSKAGALFESKSMIKLSAEQKNAIINALATKGTEPQPYDWAENATNIAFKNMSGKKPPKPQVIKAIIATFGVRDEREKPVLNKKGQVIPDTDLKEYENVPYSKSISEYMAEEVLPYVPDAWVDTSVIDEGVLSDGGVGIVGTNISFNKFFYHYEEPRKPEEIAKEIMELESGLEGFMREFL